MRTMQARAMRILGSRFYSRDEIQSFLDLVGTVEEAVVTEGHFFVAIDSEQRAIGSGGWSRLVPRYAQFAQSSETAHGASQPALGWATVRSVFVAPEFTRRGIAQGIMQRIETDAAAAGIFLLHLTATLSGEAFYRSIGYEGDIHSHVQLTDGTRLGCVRMCKFIAETAMPTPRAAGASQPN